MLLTRDILCNWDCVCVYVCAAMFVARLQEVCPLIVLESHGKTALFGVAALFRVPQNATPDSVKVQIIPNTSVM